MTAYQIQTAAREIILDDGSCAGARTWALESFMSARESDCGSPWLRAMQLGHAHGYLFRAREIQHDVRERLRRFHGDGWSIAFAGVAGR